APTWLARMLLKNMVAPTQPGAGAGRRGTARCRLVQITLDRVRADQRLCRPAVRKGFAFPWRLYINQPPQRRLEGCAFQTALRKRNGRAWPESHRLSAQRGGGAALATRRVL